MRPSSTWPAPGISGQVDVAGDTVTVSVEATQATQILGIAGLHSFTVSASATATAVRGITGAGPVKSNRPIERLGNIASGSIAALIIVVIVVGGPVGLAFSVGWPLPHRVPTLGKDSCGAWSPWNFRSDAARCALLCGMAGLGLRSGLYWRRGDSHRERSRGSKKLPIVGALQPMAARLVAAVLFACCLQWHVLTLPRCYCIALPWPNNCIPMQPGSWPTSSCPPQFRRRRSRIRVRASNRRRRPAKFPLGLTPLFPTTTYGQSA